MMDEDIAKIHEDAAAEVMRLWRGMVFNANLIKSYYEILQAEGLPEPIILIAIEQWVKARNRMEVEPMLHHIYMQQHQAHEEPVQQETT